METALAAHLRALELRLLEPAVRASREELERLLDPQFVEFGASGRRFERGDIVAELANEVAANYRAHDFECIELSPTLAQLRYLSTTVRGGQVLQARRSSLWQRGASGWRMLFHQGTVFVQDAEHS